LRQRLQLPVRSPFKPDTLAPRVESVDEDTLDAAQRLSRLEQKDIARLQSVNTADFLDSLRGEPLATFFISDRFNPSMSFHFTFRNTTVFTLLLEKEIDGYIKFQNNPLHLPVELSLPKSNQLEQGIGAGERFEMVLSVAIKAQVTRETIRHELEVHKDGTVSVDFSDLRLWFQAKEKQLAQRGLIRLGKEEIKSPWPDL
jgi:hypothetical protein